MDGQDFSWTASDINVDRILPHYMGCFVYKHAAMLLGVDRRGMCDCGTEKHNLWVIEQREKNGQPRNN